MDYFALFSLRRYLHIDSAGLERSFYAQSRRLHPDRFAAKAPEKQNEALKRSSELNDAYRTLRDPIARTEYLLSLEGVQMEEQSRQATDQARAAGTKKVQIAPPDLLEEAFELNMQLEEMRFARQTGEKDAEAEYNLRGARDRYTALLNDLQTELEALWTRWDAAEQAENEVEKKTAKEAMIALLNRRSYVRNLVRDVHAALE